MADELNRFVNPDSKSKGSGDSQGLKARLQKQQLPTDIKKMQQRIK
jgi:hypothetical protein